MAAKAWGLSLAAILVACSASSEERSAAPVGADAPAATPTPDVAPTPCAPLAVGEEPTNLGPYPYAIAGRASDGTIYAISGTDFDVRVFSSQDGVLRMRFPTHFAASEQRQDDLIWDLDASTRLYITRFLFNGDYRHTPTAVWHNGTQEPLTPIASEDVMKLDVRLPVPAYVWSKATMADGTRFMLVHRSLGSLGGEQYRAFYGQPPTIVERSIVEIQRDRTNVPTHVVLEVDGAQITIAAPPDLTPAVPGDVPSTDPSHGFTAGLSFLCR